MVTIIKEGRTITTNENFLKKEEFDKLSTLIYGVLKDCIDSQIFIENSIIEKMIDDNIILQQNYAKGFHYGGGDMLQGESTYDFKDRKSRIDLMSNCKGYKQVVLFRRVDMDYQHYLQGIKQVVFFNEDR